MRKIGFIGMGVMGLPMAVNLVKKSGQEIMGFDIFEEKRQIFAKEGGIAVDSSVEICKSCNIIFLCLPTNELVKSCIEDVLEQGMTGTTIIDMSSTAPALIKEMYAKAKEKGIHLLDSPVSGGESGAVAATLAIMTGGDKEVFDQCEDLLHYLGSAVTYMGPTSCGSVAKLANNMIVGCNLASVSEAYAFAAKAGIDPELLFTAIKDGFAGSAVMTIKVPKLISRDFSASARIAVHKKDLTNAVKVAEEMGVEIPMSKMVLEYMQEMDADGKVNEDQIALAQIYEKRMGVKIEKLNH